MMMMVTMGRGIDMSKEIDIPKENAVYTIESYGQKSKTMIVAKELMTEEEARAISKIIFVDFKTKQYSRVVLDVSKSKDTVKEIKPAPAKV